MHRRLSHVLAGVVSTGIILSAQRLPGDAQVVARPHGAVPIPSASYAPRSPIGRTSVRHRRAPRRTAAVGTLLFSAPFTGSGTTPGRYLYSGDTCITAGQSAPPNQVPGCGSAAPLDANGAGALELTTPATTQQGFIVTNPTFATSAGLVITYTDYSFGGSTPSADGLAMFLSDASKAEPTAPGQSGGSLGYANGTNASGVANAYLGVGMDEYGNFSNPTEGRNGGPAPSPRRWPCAERLRRAGSISRVRRTPPERRPAYRSTSISRRQHRVPKMHRPCK